jgi:hypothetical protein
MGHGPQVKDHLRFFVSVRVRQARQSDQLERIVPDNILVNSVTIIGDGAFGPINLVRNVKDAAMPTA